MLSRTSAVSRAMTSADWRAFFVAAAAALSAMAAGMGRGEKGYVREKIVSPVDRRTVTLKVRAARLVVTSANRSPVAEKAYSASLPNGTMANAMRAGPSTDT